MDAGPELVDAGQQALDAGPAPDAAAQDAGRPADGGASDAQVMDTGADPSQLITPLFGPQTQLEPALVEDSPSALITRFADRGRDRHARESQFRAYEHYLPLYWEHRTVQVEIVDTIGRGGDTITFNVATEWKLQDRQAELRFFYRGQSTVAEYHDNAPMTPIDRLNYTRSASFNAREGRAIEVGDRMEFELSQFLDAPPRGRSNYYGTTYLYVVGQGIVPWVGSGPQRDSVPLPSPSLLGGATTLHANESNEPEYLFSQMATNTAPQHGQAFVLGRRVAHTDFGDGSHDESPDNPVWREQGAKTGPNYVNASCNACHLRNGRALPPAPNSGLAQYVVKVGDESGAAHPDMGTVLQPVSTGGGSEPAAHLTSWVEQDGLRRPQYAFDGPPPDRFSPRISPQLVGLGLLEAIDEADVIALADPQDADGDGISGRLHIVRDAESGAFRLGRFGYKAAQPTVRQQTAGALRTDMGVLTSVYPSPDCGSAQTGCGDDGAELADEHLDDLVAYVALLGVPPQTDFDAPQVQAGAQLFEQVGCAKCHVSTFTTSSYAKLAELRGQVISPYTDLLLHDLGPELGDNLGEGDASGAEWRTAPLWGIGKSAGVSGGQAYLHDGRARSLEEAILWHGGEAQDSRAEFKALEAAEQGMLLRFLESL